MFKVLPRNLIEEILDESGIYVIVNKVNNNKYVGQSISVKTRVAQHMQSLRSGKHSNGHLQYAYNKYGIGVFKFYVLEYINRFALNYREQYWINELAPEYNIQQNIETNEVHEENNVEGGIVFIRLGEEYKRKIWEPWVYGGCKRLRNIKP